MMNRYVNGYVDLLNDWIWYWHVDLLHMVYRYRHMDLLHVMNGYVDLLHMVVMHRVHMVRYVNDVVFAKILNYIVFFQKIRGLLCSALS